MDIFSASPKSFKLRGKSPLAAELKSSISAMLPRFLSDYSDAILAEYITVLVCNGKHQYQAREDLEAFLGDRAVEFVTWLWNHILQYAAESSAEISLSYPDEAAVVSSQDGGRCKGARTAKCAEFQSHSTNEADELLMKDDGTYHVSTCEPVSTKGTNVSKCSQHGPSFPARLSEVNTKKALSGTCRNEVSRTIATENINHKVDPRTQCIMKINQILKEQSSALPKEHLHLTKREPVPQNTQSFIQERPCASQICSSYHFGSSLPPRFLGTQTLHSEKRGSVWDRLGKPCADIAVRHESISFYDVGHKDEDRYFQNRLALRPLNRTTEAPAVGQTYYTYCDETKKLEQGVSGGIEPRCAHNIGRKRFFGEISTGPGTGLVSLMHERDVGPQCKDASQDFKKSNLTKTGQKTTQKLVSEVLDVKQRLHQIEMEMLKLQARKAEIEKTGGKVNHSSNAGMLKDSEKNIEIQSRTVLVTNVHFSATKEALSSFFANCGGVVKVVILTDIVTAQPKGSAYVTFASKESVDKAVALSGRTTFYSRTLNVVRKEDAATVAAAPMQLPAKNFHAYPPHGNTKAIPKRPRYSRSSLQWRREPSTGLSEPSAPASTEGVSSFGPKQSDSREEGETSSTERPTTADLHGEEKPSPPELPEIVDSQGEGITSSTEPPATASA